MLADPAQSGRRDRARIPSAPGASRRNAASLGVPDLEIVEGEAPDALAGLPPPDAVFIGGGATDAGPHRPVLDGAARRAGGWSSTR